ncbi:MAG: aldehyde dehydrogenase family protein, partial [Bacteroidales bacterium]
MNYNEITAIYQRQKEFFSTGSTRSVEFRINALKHLKQAILNIQPQILDALWKDLHKSPEEAYLTEIGIVLSEIDNHIRNLRKWAKPLRIPTPLSLFPSSSHLISEPLGVTLVVSPWNYPFQLMMNPLIGSISAGCCTILKPSPDSPQLSSVIAEMIGEIFPSEYITTIQGGKEENIILFSLKFDLIFFTGSPSLGKVVMQAAAQHLTPVILELGGKSPCIVHSDAQIDLTAKRIIWGKLMNAGQTCIAPDYLFVHSSVKEQLLKRLDHYIREFYGNDPQTSRFYPRIVSQAAMHRLLAMIDPDKIYCGGRSDMDDKYIEPTILTGITEHDPIMQEEIFG